jgi:hypothetical protein
LPLVTAPTGLNAKKEKQREFIPQEVADGCQHLDRS